MKWMGDIWRKLFKCKCPGEFMLGDVVVPIGGFDKYIVFVREGQGFAVKPIDEDIDLSFTYMAQDDENWVRVGRWDFRKCKEFPDD